MFVQKMECFKSCVPGVVTQVISEFTLWDISLGALFDPHCNVLLIYPISYILYVISSLTPMDHSNIGQPSIHGTDIFIILLVGN